MDVERQIEYWRVGSLEDMEVAGELMEKRRFRHGLFFAHLALEKMLKAHVTRQTEEIPPRIHNLSRLAEIVGLSLPDERKIFLRDFEVYQIESRYPDSLKGRISAETAHADMLKAEEMLKWLKAKL